MNLSSNLVYMYPCFEIEVAYGLLDHRQYRFQNGLETGSRARIKSTQTVQEGPSCQRIAVANAVLAYSVEVWG